MLINEIKVGYFLCFKRIARSGFLSNFLIGFIMTLTVLNIFFTRGILVGLPKGAVDAIVNFYYGDLYISPKIDKSFIDDDKQVINILKKNTYIDTFSVRYLAPVFINADINQKISDSKKGNNTTKQLLAINIDDEDKVTSIKSNITTGSYFDKNSTDQIIIGKSLLANYASSEALAEDVLTDVGVGSIVELTVYNKTYKAKIVGVLDTKTSSYDRKIIMSDKFLKQFADNTKYKPSEISIKLKSGVTDYFVQSKLKESGLHYYADIENKIEYQPSFVVDITNTFSLLSNVIGSIGMVVSAITIFIIIFVNALTQRKLIGILKGIGISANAIIISYVLQAIFYAVIGISIGMSIMYLWLVPYFSNNPIDFPFSDGILYLETVDSIIRCTILLITTAIAGYIPSRKIVNQNTLDAILGR